MGKAKGIIMIAAGAIVLAVGIQTFVSAPERTGQIENAVYIENGQVLPENEGKLVIVSGKLEAEMPLEDNVTGVKIPSPTATRNVQIYEANTIDNETTWDWEPVGNDYSEEGNGGINTPSLVSSTLVAPTKIGDFNISEKFLVSLLRTENFKDYDYDALAENGWNLFEGQDGVSYLSESGELPLKITKEDTISNRHMYGSYEGKIRISYQTMSSNDPLIYTFVGTQQGNDLVQAKDLKITSVYQGVKTADELAISNKNSSVGGLFLGIVIGILLLFFGIRSLRKNIGR
ncbi:MAG: TMEM43 family protein [Hominilimicola sp.]